MPERRPIDRSRLGQSYHRGIVPIDPGQPIRTVIANAYPEYKSFRLKTGRHILYDELDIDLDGVVLYGDWATELVLYSAGSRITLSGEGSGLVGPRVVRDDLIHATDMVRMTGHYSRVQDVLFGDPDDGATYYPLHVVGAYNVQVLDNVFRTETIISKLTTHVYADNASLYGHYCGNHLGRYTGAGPARRLISVQSAGFHEAGQTSNAPGATYRSYSNYADVAVRL